MPPERFPLFTPTQVLEAECRPAKPLDCWVVAAMHASGYWKLITKRAVDYGVYDLFRTLEQAEEFARELTIFWGNVRFFHLEIPGGKVVADGK